jgi:copper transport protein
VRRLLAAAAVAVAIGVVVDGTPAQAHAELISVTPPDGEVLDAPPSEVVLTFSEPVSLTGGSVRVLDDETNDVATDTTSAGSTVTTTLAAGMADGTYTIVWEVVSVDSHRIGGASVFHVGAPTSQGLTGDELELSADAAGWGVRLGAVLLSAVGYAGALIAAGTLAFTMYADPRAKLHVVTSRAAVIGAVALLGAVPFRIARLGGGLDALRDDDVLLSALRGPVGVSTAVTAAALLVVAILVDRRVPARFTALVALLALAGFSIEGHTRATNRRLAMVISDVVHLVAGAVWLGGVVGLVLAFRAGTDTRSLARIVRRFSASALVAVAVVAITGVLMAWIILPTAGELTGTGYGWALIVKVSLVVVVVAIGAFNRYRLVPAVEARDESRTWLRRTVLAELAVLLAVVGVTAVMVTRSPLQSTSSSAAAAPSAEELTVELTGGGSADVSVTPARTGFNVVDVTVRDGEGRVVNPYEAPVVELSLPALDVGPLTPEVLPLGIGRYQATANLGFAGEWELTLRVRVAEFESVNGTATITIP